MGGLGPDENHLKFESLQLHAGAPRVDNATSITPIYASTSFVFNNSAHGAAIFSGEAEAFCYSRIGNPTMDVVEKRVAELEGGVGALATASGEAAIFIAIMTLATTGSNIIVGSHVSDRTSDQFRFRLPPYGISAKFVESGAANEVRDAIDENTKAVFVESISNESLLVADLEELATVAHEAGVPLIVDNTAGAGGFLIRPFDHGADIVVESAKEWLSISGSVTAGLIIDSGNFNWQTHAKRFPQFMEPMEGFHGMKMWEKFGKTSFIVFARSAVLRDMGPCLNPFEAFQLIAGLETLSVRVDRHCENSLALATWLEIGSDRLKIKSVQYPGLTSNPTHDHAQKYLRKGKFGGILAFTLKEHHQSSLISNFFEGAKVLSSGSSIGGSKTVVIFHNPSNLESQEAESLVHVSVGIENIDDIIVDFGRALEGNSTIVKRSLAKESAATISG